MQKLTKEMIKETYIYTYPIMGMMDLLSQQVINPETKTTGLNEFMHIAELSSPKTSFVPAPNNDTTYSRAWLDLRKEPVIIDVPDTHERFYSVQLLDMFSETIANVGKRTTGTQAQRYAVVGPNWNGELPEDVFQVRSNTTIVLAFLRILIHNEADLKEVKELQNAIQVYPLSKEGIHEALPVYSNQNYADFFRTAEEVMKLIPEGGNEAKFKEIIQLINQEHPQDLESICKETMEEIDKAGLEFGENINNWRIAIRGIGNYGTDYLQRAVVWFKGALANQPQESLYPSTFQDQNKEMLNGQNHYRIHFTKENLPPVSQFWSLTMYIFRNGFLYDNEIDRYSIGDRTQGLIYGEDGSLTLYIQNDKPSQTQNWLPAPPEQFYMTLRLYGPSEDAIQGLWKPPFVEKVD